MIRIEEFLFVEDVESSQAEHLVSTYPDLTFRTKDEFYKFFEYQKIKLQKRKNTLSPNDKTAGKNSILESQQLLSRLKEFKSSSDYDYVRKYIIKQKVIQESISSNNLELAQSTLSEIDKEEVDPFFNFVVRKLLTGSETGLLPSENLKSLINDLTKSEQQPSINLNTDVVRDESNRIVTYKNYLKNKGSVLIPIVDYRFVLSSANYVVPRQFSSIEDAVNAERNVLQKAQDWASDITIGADEAVLIEKLKELINRDETSLPALEIKVEELKQQLEDTKIRETELTTTNDNLVEAIEQLSNEFIAKDNENTALGEQISVLNQVIDTTITELESSVTEQLDETKASFDNLSTTLAEESAKRSEELKRIQEQAAAQAAAQAEQATAQLEAFKTSIEKVVDSIAKSGQNNTGGGQNNTGGNNTTGGGQNNTGGGLTDIQRKIARMSGVLQNDVAFINRTSDQKKLPFAIFDDFARVLGPELKWKIISDKVLWTDTAEGTSAPSRTPSKLFWTGGFGPGDNGGTQANLLAYQSIMPKMVYALTGIDPRKEPKELDPVDRIKQVQPETVETLWDIFSRYKTISFDTPKLYDIDPLWDTAYIRKILGSVPPEYQSLFNPDVLSPAAEADARRTIKDVVNSQLPKAINNPEIVFRVFDAISSLLDVKIPWDGSIRPNTIGGSDWDASLRESANIIKNAIDAVPSNDDSVLAVIFGTLKLPEYGQLITKRLAGSERPQRTDKDPGPTCTRDSALSKIRQIVTEPKVVNSDEFRKDVLKTIRGSISTTDLGQTGLFWSFAIGTFFVLGGPIPSAEAYTSYINHILSTILPNADLQDVCDLSFNLGGTYEKATLPDPPKGGVSYGKYPQ